MPITITSDGEIVCDCGTAGAEVWYEGLDEMPFDGLETAEDGDDVDKVAARLIEAGVQIILSREIKLNVQPNKPSWGYDQRADMETIACGILSNALADRINQAWDKQAAAAKAGRRGGKRLL